MDKAYVVLLDSIEGVETDETLIRAHVSFLKRLEKDGRYILGGPFSSFPGGMYILRADSLEHAQETAQKDPFVETNAKTLEVREWVLSSTENNHLGMG